MIDKLLTAVAMISAATSSASSTTPASRNKAMAVRLSAANRETVFAPAGSLSCVSDDALRDGEA